MLDTYTRYEKINFTTEINALPQKLRYVLRDVSRIADDMGLFAYVVGGFVRDLILGARNLDIDIVIEGDAIEFAKKLLSRYTGKLIIHETFNTATMELKDSLKIDFAMARKEIYKHPAALPSIMTGGLEDDLYRRDFTINSMGIRLNKRGFGDIIDPYNGRWDLKCGIISVMHKLSFIEDPTRIMRAIRFEKRYGFGMSKLTQKLVEEAINSGVLGLLSRERIDSEFMAVLGEPHRALIFKRMRELGVFRETYPEINFSSKVEKLLEDMEGILEVFKERLKGKRTFDKILIYILILYSDTDLKTGEGHLEKIRFKKKYKNNILSFANKKNNAFSRLSNLPIPSNYDVYNILQGFSMEELFVLYMLSGCENMNNTIIRYINCYRNIKIHITGADLKRMGVSPGPVYSFLFEKIRKERISGNFTTYDEELVFLENAIQTMRENKEL